MLRLPAEVADAIFELVRSAKTPVAAIIRERIGPPEHYSDSIPCEKATSPRKQFVDASPPASVSCSITAHNNESLADELESPTSIVEPLNTAVQQDLLKSQQGDWIAGENEALQVQPKAADDSAKEKNLESLTLEGSVTHPEESIQFAAGASRAVKSVQICPQDAPNDSVHEYLADVHQADLHAAVTQDVGSELDISNGENIPNICSNVIVREKDAIDMDGEKDDLCQMRESGLESDMPKSQSIQDSPRNWGSQMQLVQDALNFSDDELHRAKDESSVELNQRRSDEKAIEFVELSKPNTAGFSLSDEMDGNRNCEGSSTSDQESERQLIGCCSTQDSNLSNAQVYNEHLLQDLSEEGGPTLQEVSTADMDNVDAGHLVTVSRNDEAATLPDSDAILENYSSVSVQDEQRNSSANARVEFVSPLSVADKASRTIEDSDSESDQEVDSPQPANCPKSDVALMAESWTPEPSSFMVTIPEALTITLNPEIPNPSFDQAEQSADISTLASSFNAVSTSNDEVEHIFAVLEPKINEHLLSQTYQSSDISKTYFDPTTSTEPIQLASNSDLRPQDKVDDSLVNLRQALHLACRRRGIADAGRFVEQLLTSALAVQKRETKSGRTARISVANLATALSKTGLHLRKYMVRPLMQDLAFFEKELLKVDVFLEALNSQQWWPMKKDLESNFDQLEMLRQELEKKFGPKISAALFAEKNVDYLNALLVEAARDEDALREMKSYVDAALQKQCVEDLLQLHSSEDGSIIRPRTISPDPVKKIDVAIISPYERSKSPFTTARFSRTYERGEERSKRPAVKTIEPKQDSELPVIGHTQIKSSGISPSCEAEGYFPALSRKKGIEYSKSIQKPAVDNSARFWQRRQFPIHGVEYKRWALLRNPTLPGFSDPKYVLLSKPEQSWEIPPQPLMKSGSRFKEPFSISPSLEMVDKSGMYKADLKLKRFNSKLSMQGGDLLRNARKLVSIGDYDGALRMADSSYQSLRSSGDRHMIESEELCQSTPVAFVALAIKNEIEKKLRVSRSQLERNNFERALEQIPYLLHASRWINELRTVCDEPIPNTSESVRMIDLLTDRIVEGQKTFALSVEAISLRSYFSSVRIEFDANGTLTPESVAEATERKNRLPETIIADGQSYVLVLDAKPADVPAKLPLGTKLKVQGSVTFGSGRRDNGSKPRYGTVTAFNESSSKYKIQYPDDYEWLSWPVINHQCMVEIDIYPEDVEIEIDGFSVHSKTVNLMRSRKKESGLILVVFSVTPLGPPSDLSPYGRVYASVTGIKSKKALLDSQDSGIVHVIPPLFLLPSARYFLFDAVHHQPLEQGVAEFTHVISNTKFTFSPGQEVAIPLDGIYNICFRGQTHFDSPSLTFIHKTCVVLNSVSRRLCTATSKIFLNEPFLQKDELRVVVAWDAEPLELDLHIYTSSGEHSSDRDCDPSNTGDIRIHMDSVAGFGPETATIRVKKNLAYSISVCLSPGTERAKNWKSCNATVSLYDSSGIFSLFHLPPSKFSNKSLGWWHILALDGSKWDRPGHGVLRINKLTANEMPQVFFFCQSYIN